MPIDYSKYPDDWKTRIRPDILKRAGQTETEKAKCENCGVENYKTGSRDHTRKFWSFEE